MKINGVPEFEEKSELSPIKLTSQQKEMCRRLDWLSQSTNQGQKLSKLFRGAIFTVREENRSNPDWIAQSAHSFREVLYPFLNKRSKIKLKVALTNYGSAITEEEASIISTKTVYGKMTKVAHHEQISIEDYEILIEEFQRELLHALDRQVDIHDQIDKFLLRKQYKKSDSKNWNQDDNVKEAKRLISLNEDSRKYFYDQADENWLKWLWENGFFDVLKKKAKEPRKFSYRTPELHYLVRMNEHKLKMITQIILDTPISKETFNPEVIDQFLRICGNLPGEQLAKLTGKIKSENWPALMHQYNHWGFEYEEMFGSLDKSGHHEEIIELASAILVFREDWETIIEKDYYNATPFCLENLSYSKVFYYLSNIDEKYIEDALYLSLSVIKKLTASHKDDKNRSSTFEQKDRYPLYDMDIFTIGLRSEYHGSGNDDVRELVALVKTLTVRVLAQNCAKKAKEIYGQYFLSLPDSWLMWRICLFVLSFCPMEFMSYLKEALFRVFKEDRYSELIMGAEYKKALIKAFPLMEKNDQIRFVNMAKDLFSDDKNSSKKRDGNCIFSVIEGNLLDEQIAELVNAGFKFYSEYIPTPAIGKGEGGFVTAKGPVNQEEFRKISVSKIVDNLKGVWSPARLIEQDNHRDFLNPLNAEGMGKLIREDVKTRIQEYLEHANDLLDRKNLDLHYLYSLLNGFADALDGNMKPLNKTEWELLVSFCLRIIQSVKEKPVEKLEYETNVNTAWLGRWNAVFDAMEHLLKKVLGTSGKKLGFKWKAHRSDILSIIDYYFDFPDPIPEDEQIGSAKITVSVGNEKPLVSDPFTLAINSIRGQAFELFILAVDLDSQNDKNLKRFGLSPDIKRMYEALLSKEKTRAIMFMFGRYLARFFYLDKIWLKSILNKIFPTEERKKYLYSAAWEGYLSNEPYLELFKDKEFQNLYKRAILMTDKDYPQQKHFLEPDKITAHHFALAYMVLDFGFGNELFDYLWTKGSLVQHIAFVDKLGRLFISGENPKALKLIRDNENARNKLKTMWTWLLDNYSDPKVFNEIGFWINLDKGIFTKNELAGYLSKTLVKTEGYLNWDIGLQDNIVALAKASTKDTVEIARLYLLEGGVRKRLNSPHFILDEKWVEAFGVLYQHPETKQETLSLINYLILEGGRFFWKLKDVLQSN